MGRPSAFVISITFVLLCLIWGTTWSVIQIGLVGIPPLTGVALRFAIAAALLLVLIGVRRIRLGTTRRERLLWLSNSVLSFSVSYGVVYWAEQWVPSGLTSVLFATYPLFVALLAHYMLPAETLRRPEVIGIALGWAAHRRGSLSLPIFMHAGINLLGAIVLMWGDEIVDYLERTQDQLQALAAILGLG